jgi:hypothetical protein
LEIVSESSIQESEADPIVAGQCASIAESPDALLHLEACHDHISGPVDRLTLIQRTMVATIQSKFLIHEHPGSEYRNGCVTGHNGLVHDSNPLINVLPFGTERLTR